MDRLEMPKLFACRGVDRNDAVRVEIVADPVASIEIVGGRSPVVASAIPRFSSMATPPHALTPPADFQYRILRPGVITFFAGIWNRVERPEQLSAVNVPAAEISWRRWRSGFRARRHA